MKTPAHNREGQSNAVPHPVSRSASSPFPSIWLLFRIWGKIGLQSFGGGATTTLLIQREFVEEHGWLTQEELTRLWSMCVMTPGINLVSLTILIGRKLGGFWGVVLSLTGLLLPSAIITCLLTAGFKAVESSPIVQAMLRGIVPATGGIMLVVGLKFAQPLFKQGKQEGAFNLFACIVIVLVATLAVILLKISVVFVLICAGLLGIGLFSVKPPPVVPIALPAPESLDNLNNPDSKRGEP
jgi:chromate transporter